VHNFSKFLNAMALESVSERSPEANRFLAVSYSILEQHSQAADFLAKIPPPRPDGGKMDPERESAYQNLQLMHVRELRLARRFDEAQTKLRDVLRADWGKKNVDVQKELINLWEDRGDYAAAARGWNELMTTVRPLMDQNARFKDLYYECYYHVVFCLCKSADKAADDKKKNDDIYKAANWYVKLKKIKDDMGGSSLMSRYAALQESTPAFKKACEELLKNAP
jgi:hypothetical protein